MLYYRAKSFLAKMGLLVCSTTVEQNQSRPEWKYEYALPWKPRLTWKSILVFARTG